MRSSFMAAAMDNFSTLIVQKLIVAGLRISELTHLKICNVSRNAAVETFFTKLSKLN